MTTSLLSARPLAPWLKAGLLSLLVVALCWSGMLWYWRASGRLPAGADLALGLLVLPLGILGACWAGKRTLGRRVPAPAAASPAAAAMPATVANAAPPAALAILATSLRMPHGVSPEELLAMLARDKAQPDLDPELIDDDGLPVMAARSSDGDDELLQEQIGAWLAQSGMANLAWSEEDWRALTLGSAALRELAHAAAGAVAPDATLRLVALLPPHWPADARHAAAEWWRHVLAQSGLPAARIAVEQAQGGAPAVLARLAQKAAPGPAILLACASYIGQETVDRWSAGGLLFRAAHPRGLVPGEGAAGLLVGGMTQDTGITQLLLASEACDPAVSAHKRIAPALLARLAGDLLQTTAPDDVALIVADTGADTRHVLELMEFAGGATPQLDDSSDILRLGPACGACDGVPFVAALALARAAALERGAPVLCVSNQDPAMRAVALVRYLI